MNVWPWRLDWLGEILTVVAWFGLPILALIVALAQFIYIGLAYDDAWAWWLVNALARIALL